MYPAAPIDKNILVSFEDKLSKIERALDVQVEHPTSADSVRHESDKACHDAGKDIDRDSQKICGCGLESYTHASASLSRGQSDQYQAFRTLDRNE